MCDPKWQVKSHRSQMGFSGRAISAFTFTFHCFCSNADITDTADSNVNVMMSVTACWEGGVWTQTEGTRETLHTNHHKALPGCWRRRNAQWCWGIPGCRRSFGRGRSQRPDHRRSWLNIFEWQFWLIPDNLVTLATSFKLLHLIQSCVSHHDICNTLYFRRIFLQCRDFTAYWNVEVLPYFNLTSYTVFASIFEATVVQTEFLQVF